ncbi:hypothetical protein [Fodinicola feengrottensis]|nr:hypothetical protein [Fodinicola feengrottensis]
MARFGRPLDDVDIAAATASPAVDLPGYGELMRRMESAPGNRQAFVEVTDSSGDVSVFLAHRDPLHVAFLDLGWSRAARFPAGDVRIRLIGLPGTMSLAERLDRIREARPPAELLAAPIVWPRGATLVGPDVPTPVVVLGDADKVLQDLVEQLAGWAEAIGQPIVVAGHGRTPRPVPGGQVRALRSLLSQFGFRWKVPVVLTFGAVDDNRPETARLYGALDDFHVSLVHRVPAGFDYRWTVRPGSTADGQPPGSAQLALPLLVFAAGKDRRPASASTTEAATFVSTSLTTLLGGLGGPVKQLAPWVHQIANRDPEAAAHSAALQLVAGGHQDILSKVLAGNPRERIFESLAGLGGDTPVDHQRGVQTLLPLLSQLAGGFDLKDLASQAALTALNDLLGGTKDHAQILKELSDSKDYLTDQARVDLVRLIQNLASKMPKEDLKKYEVATQLILTC